MSVKIADFVEKGGVFDNVEGSTPEEVYQNVTKMMELPAGLTATAICDALSAREKVMSTAVGNSIALPHARTPIIENELDQRICVVYLKTPLDMHAPDSNLVRTMFIILSQNSQTHLQILSNLVGLFQKSQFRKVLDKHAPKTELLAAINEMA